MRRRNMSQLRVVVGRFARWRWWEDVSEYTAMLPHNDKLLHELQRKAEHCAQGKVARLARHQSGYRLALRTMQWRSDQDGATTPNPSIEETKAVWKRNNAATDVRLTTDGLMFETFNVAIFKKLILKKMWKPQKIETHTHTCTHTHIETIYFNKTKYQRYWKLI